MEREGKQKLREFSRATQSRAKVLSPVDKGRMRASIKIVYSGGLGGVGNLRSKIGPTVDYAVMVEDGTRPHIIRPRNKRALRFRPGGSGRYVFAKFVRHPGTRPQPFMDRALVETAGRFGWRVRQRG
jgi:hypothetical protein